MSASDLKASLLPSGQPEGVAPEEKTVDEIKQEPKNKWEPRLLTTAGALFSCIFSWAICQNLPLFNFYGWGLSVFAVAGLFFPFAAALACLSLMIFTLHDLEKWKEKSVKERSLLLLKLSALMAIVAGCFIFNAALLSTYFFASFTIIPYIAPACFVFATLALAFFNAGNEKETHQKIIGFTALFLQTMGATAFLFGGLAAAGLISFTLPLAATLSMIGLGTIGALMMIRADKILMAWYNKENGKENSPFIQLCVVCMLGIFAGTLATILGASITGVFFIGLAAITLSVGALWIGKKVPSCCCRNSYSLFDDTKQKESDNSQLSDTDANTCVRVPA